MATLHPDQGLTPRMSARAHLPQLCPAVIYRQRWLEEEDRAGERLYRVRVRVRVGVGRVREMQFRNSVLSGRGSG